MKNLIHLYIGNEEVEFSTPPEILFNYAVTELNNPTIVKNSFSKTIEIEGTPNNNAIFGHFWNVERLQNTSGEGNGVYFNASHKIPFKLYLNNDILETGYVKLDNVISNLNSIKYQITLFGGLGQFFYNLSTDAEGEPRKLSSLELGTDIGFTINIDTVKEAWDNLYGYSNKWNTINFMTAYEGYPSDFECDKVLINTKNTGLVKSKGQDGKNYGTKNGWCMGELPNEMTEWEIRDLRSYLQRPVIRWKSIIEAICNPINNGGYTVHLDEDFFNNNNPYWYKTWMTLPLIQNLEYGNEENVLDDNELIENETDGKTSSYMYQPLIPSLGEFSQTIPSSINVRCKIKMNNVSFPYTSFVWYWNKKGDSYHSGHACYGSLFVQLIAKNGDTVVGASQTYNLTSPNRHDGDLRFGNNSRYEASHKYSPYLNKPIYDRLGWLQNHYWCYEDSKEPMEFDFKITGINSPITGLEVVYFWGSSDDKRKKDGVNGMYAEPWDSGWATYSRSWQSVNDSNLTIEILSSNVKVVLGASLGRTQTKIDKYLLLNTEKTPADYFLSYIKMFGLYVTKDKITNDIYVTTRKNFYKRNDVRDLTPLLSKEEVNILPLTFDTKWVEFANESYETDFYNTYKTSRGVEYGCKILNTGYEFIADKKNLIKDSVFKNAIEGLEKSKYYLSYTNDKNIRSWFNGLKYNLYNGDDKIEVIASTASAGNLLPINDVEGLKYYDLFPKIQLHSENDGEDGNNILVFFSGFKDVVNRAVPLYYYLTDDTQYQTALNEGKPCWMFTTEEVSGDKRVAYRLEKIPVFERYLTAEGNTKVERSLDFGTPQELFVPNYSITEDVNIYSAYWKSYLEDLYDVNNRVLTAYVNIDMVDVDTLKAFYWFDNVIWVISKIVDYNPASPNLTKVEFIKVANIGNYTNEEVKDTTGYINIESDVVIVPWDGQDFVVKIETPEDTGWKILYTFDGLITSIDSGVGTEEVGFIVSANNTSEIRPIYVTAINDEGQTAKLTLLQEYQDATYVDVSQSSLIVSAEGGEYDIDFNWYNQGDNYINTYRIEGDILASSNIGAEFDNTATIKIAPNNEETITSGKVIFESGNYNGSVGIDVLPREIKFGKDGGEYEMIFNYNTPEFSGVPYWITIINNGGGSYTLKANPNYYPSPQLSTITVIGQNSSNIASFNVFQSEGGIYQPNEGSVSPNNLYFEKEGGIQYVSVNIPNIWSSITSDSWINVSKTTGDGEMIISVSVGANNMNVERTGNITYTDRISGKLYSVTITQYGANNIKSFEVTPTTIEVPADGATYTATISYIGRGGDIVEISHDENIRTSAITWVGEIGTFTIDVPQNPYTTENNFDILLTCDLGTYTINVVQLSSNPSISVDGSVVNIDGNGGTINNGVSANLDWIATTDSDWLSVNPSSGTLGYTTISIEVEPNPNIESRSGEVYIQNTDGETLNTITINQGGFIEILSVSPSNITFDAEGGTATITIKSNTNWIINGTN